MLRSKREEADRDRGCVPATAPGGQDVRGLQAGLGGGQGLRRARIEPEALKAGAEQVAAQEQVRHNRIDDVIESTELKAMYRLATEHDLSHDPREIEMGSPESLLGVLLR